MKTKAEVTSYFEAQSFLKGKEHRKIAHNTYVVKINNTAVGIKYYYTFIIIYYNNGNIKLNTDGWETFTTKFRLNKFLPQKYSIQQRNFVWTLETNFEKPGILFFDGMVIETEEERDQFYGKHLL